MAADARLAVAAGRLLVCHRQQFTAQRVLLGHWAQLRLTVLPAPGVGQNAYGLSCACAERCMQARAQQHLGSGHCPGAAWEPPAAGQALA